MSTIANTTTEMPRGPLDGCLVLSLAEQLPGPYATLLLADMGAEVIQVERPGTGDPARAFPDYYASISRNKKSICLNLKIDADRESFYALVRRADVVMEGYSPGTAERLGVGYLSLQEINPAIIYVSISGFGQTGPLRQRPAHDLSYQAIAGVLAGSGATEDVPTFPMGDMAAATFAALGVTTALVGRTRTGRGTHVDVSMVDCLASWMTPFLVPAINGGIQIDVTESPGYGLFVCADERVLSLSVAHEDHFWCRLCNLLSLEDIADANHSDRIRRKDELRALVAAQIKLRKMEDWATLLDGAGIPWSPLNSLQDVANDEHFLSRGLFERVANQNGKTSIHIRQPLKFEGFQMHRLSPPPSLGEHQSLVSSKVLG